VPQATHLAASSAFWVPQLGQNIVEIPPSRSDLSTSALTKISEARCSTATASKQNRTRRGPYYVLALEGHSFERIVGLRNTSPTVHRNPTNAG
jgi:hypothetical protein